MQAFVSDAGRSGGVRRRQVLTAALVALVVSGSAHALEIPQSAESTARDIPGSLIHGPAECFLFSHRLARREPSLISLGSHSAATRAFGVALPIAGFAFGYHVAGDIPSTTAWDVETPHSIAGFSRSFGSITFGGGFSWSTGGWKTRDESHNLDTFRSSDRRQTRFLTVNSREFSIGLGWEDARLIVDLSGSLAHESLEFRADEIRTYQETSRHSSRLLQEHFLADGGYRPAIAARVAFRLTRDTGLTGFGSYANRRQNLTQRNRFRSESSEVYGPHVVVVADSTRTYGAHAQHWQAGFAIDSRTSGGALAIVHAHFESVRPADTFRFSGLPRAYAESREEFRAGASIQLPPMAGTTILAGLSVHYGETKDSRRRGRWNEFPWTIDAVLDGHADTALSREIWHTFGWGLSRGFGGLEITGAMTAALDPFDLFLELDAQIPLW